MHCRDKVGKYDGCQQPRRRRPTRRRRRPALVHHLLAGVRSSRRPGFRLSSQCRLRRRLGGHRPSLTGPRGLVLLPLAWRRLGPWDGGPA